MSQLGRSALVGSLTTFGFSLAGFGLRFATNMVLARQLGPDLQQDYATANIYAFYAGIPLALGYSQALVQLDDSHAGVYHSVTRLTRTISLVTLAVALLATTAFALADRPGVATCFLGLVGGQIGSYVATIYESVLVRRTRYGLVAKLRLGGIAFGLVIGIAIAFIAPGPFALVLRDSLPGVVTIAVLLPMVTFGRHARELVPDAARVANAATTRVVARFGRDVFYNRGLEMAVGRLDSLMVGAALGSESLVYYEQARYIAGLPNAAVAPFSLSVGLRTFAGLVHDSPRLARAFQLVQWGLWRFLILCTVVVVIAPDLLIRIQAGPSWLPAADYLRLLGLWLAFMPIAANSQILLTALQAWWPIRKGFIIGAGALGLALVPVALSGLGALAPIAQTIGSGTVLVVFWRASRRSAPLPAAVWLNPLLAGTVASAVGLGVRAAFGAAHAPTDTSRYVVATIAAAVGALAYLVALLALEGRSLKAELRYLRDTVRRRGVS